MAPLCLLNRAPQVTTGGSNCGVMKFTGEALAHVQVEERGSEDTSSSGTQAHARLIGVVHAQHV